MRWPGGRVRSMSNPDVLAQEVAKLDGSTGGSLGPWGVVLALAPQYADLVEEGRYHAPRADDPEHMRAIVQMLLRLAVREYATRFAAALRNLNAYARSELKVRWSGWGTSGIVHWRVHLWTGGAGVEHHHYDCLFCRVNLAVLGNVGAMVPAATSRPWERHSIPCGLRGLSAQERSWNAPTSSRVGGS